MQLTSRAGNPFEPAFAARFILLLLFVSCIVQGAETNLNNHSNQPTSDRQLIVLAAPPYNSTYYADHYDAILDFHIAYAESIIGRDNVVVLGDQKTLDLLAEHLPQDVLLRADMRDIWMRDFTTINPYQPIMFRYAAAAQSGSQRDADWVQDKFANWALSTGITFTETNLILDGGNVVDNHNGRVIVTDRFLEDNTLGASEAREHLKRLLDAEQIAIVPADDDEGLAHADGMMMFIDENTLVVNRYDEPFRTQVLEEIEKSLTGPRIIEIDAQFDEEIWDERYASACGLFVNSVMTTNYLYMPLFNGARDQATVDFIQSNTEKTVVPVNAENVCIMGGSVRCLSWQIAGDNAKRVIDAARRK